jgi:uncharacterized protein YjbI with pentapeptide repeats
MKRIKHLLIGLFLGLLLGWPLGFLRFPYVEKNFSFWMGFLAALALISFLVLIVKAQNDPSSLPLAGEGNTSPGQASPPIARYSRFLLSGVIVLAFALGSWSFYRHRDAMQRQILGQEHQLQEQKAMLAFIKTSNQEPVLRSLLDDIGAELKLSAKRTLSDGSIARIAAASLAFEPYQSIEADSLAEKAYSPARGQLLQALVLMKIDTGSFAKIRRQATFAGADLQGVHLQGLDLSGIDLAGANLMDADLSGVNLTGAVLDKAKLWGAQLVSARLGGASLIRTDFSWAQLQDAVLVKANLNGAYLNNAQMLKTDLTSANFQWAHSMGAMLREAKLTAVVFKGCNLSKANLTQANLCFSDLRKANLSEADLAGAKLNRAVVDDNWSEKLKGWKAVGIKELNDGYTQVNDTFEIDGRPMYHLTINK